MKEIKKTKEKNPSLKMAMNSMYGSIVSSSKIPSKFFRPIQRRLKIENIFDGR
jgi:hypothetical protein